MKKLLLTALLAVLATTLSAAPKSLSGRTVDSEQKPIAFATVVLLNEGQQVCGTTTDEEGLFTLSCEAGKYTLTVQHISYNEYSKEIEVNDSNDLGVIVLNASDNTIDEVVVSAQLIRREADRFVVDVANSKSSVGKDGVELLERAPGVWVDDDNFSIFGRSGAKIYVDDRELKLSGEQLVNYIRTLRAEEILKIEVIPTTGADYDADSASGIIKITLRHRRENGLQGSARMAYMTNKYGTNYNPSANIALHSGGFDMNGALWYNHRDAETIAHEQTLFHTSQSELTSHSTIDNCYTNYGGRLDAVVTLHKNHSIGFGSRYNFNKEGDDTHSESLLRNNDHSELTTSKYINRDKQYDGSATFNYIWKIDTLGSTFKALADYQRRTSYGHNDNKSITNGVDSIYRDRTDANYDIGSVSLALEKNFSPRWSLKAGAKYTYYRMRSDALYEYAKANQWLVNDRESYTIDYTEQIAAAYGIVSARLGKWSLVAGLRGEYTHTQSDGTKLGKDYLSLFPNANLSWAFNREKGHSLVAQYSRKITRPSFWQLNPQRQQISDYSYQTGNPYLDPSFAHDLNVTLVLRYKYTLTGGFKLQTDEIQQNINTDPADPNILYISHINYKDTKQFYLNANIPVQLTKWWEATANLSYVAWEQRTMADAPARLSHLVMGYANTNFTLPAKFQIELSWNYHNRIQMGNVQISSGHGLNATLKKQFGKWLTANLWVKNILNQQEKIYANGEGFMRNYVLEQMWDTRSYGFSLTWNFQSGKAFRQRTLEKADDGSRL